MNHEIRGGLYNAVFGQQPFASALLAALDLRYFGLVRYRDAWIRKQGERYQIVILTRNGGPNREHSSETHAAGSDCDCVGCAITHRLPTHPLWIGDADDSFDATYAYVYFRVPTALLTEYAESLEKMAAMEPEPLGKRFKDVIESIRNAVPPAGDP